MSGVERIIRAYGQCIRPGQSMPEMNFAGKAKVQGGIRLFRSSDATGLRACLVHSGDKMAQRGYISVDHAYRQNNVPV